MDYFKIYEDLIEDRKSSGVPDGYTERHHILPKSLGGSDEEKNIIRLSARDHFFAHLLLAKIFGGPMDIALWRMCHRKSQGGEFRKITSRQFSVIRERYIDEMRKRFKGKPRPQWVVDKISKALKGRVFTEDTKRKMSLAQTGLYRGPMAEEQKKQISERMKGEGNHRFGKPTSQKQKDAVRNAVSGTKSRFYNHEKYLFVHNDGTRRFCTQYDLRAEFGINHGNLSMVCSGKRKSASGWRVINE